MHNSQRLCHKQIIYECQYCIISIRLDYNNSAWKSVKNIIRKIGSFIENVGEMLGPEVAVSYAGEIMPVLKDIKRAQLERDLSFIADVLEGKLIPWLDGKWEETDKGDTDNFFSNNLMALSETGNDELSDLLRGYDSRERKENIRCGLSFDGDTTLYFDDGEHKYNLTGQIHPFIDAVIYVYNTRKSKKEFFALAGGCMIYEAIAFMHVNIGTKIYLLEDDVEILNKIFTYYDLADYIREGRLHFLHKDLKNKVRDFINTQTLLVNNASVKCCTSEDLRCIYSKYRMIIASGMEEEYLLYLNFRENSWIDAYDAGSLIGDFAGKDMYLVAGGPSLGSSLDILRKRNDDSIIICVGTSAKKLIAEDISPDFVIISDTLPTMEKQLDQPFEYDKTSLLFLATAYSGAVKKYGGKRYRVYQNGFGPSEEAAKKEECRLFSTGGSVATLALDIALNSEAAHIYCLGFDMAYTYNQMHVSGVDETDNNSEAMPQLTVKGVRGDVIETALNLNSYREWIEHRLEEFSGKTPIINISDGAFIEGMENISCEVAMNMIQNDEEE